MNSSQDTFLVAAGQCLEDLRGRTFLSHMPHCDSRKCKKCKSEFFWGNWADKRSSRHVAHAACSKAVKGNTPLTWAELACIWPGCSVNHMVPFGPGQDDDFCSHNMLQHPCSCSEVHLSCFEGMELDWL